MYKRQRVAKYFCTCPACKTSSSFNGRWITRRTWHVHNGGKPLPDIDDALLEPPGDTKFETHTQPNVLRSILQSLNSAEEDKKVDPESETDDEMPELVVSYIYI